VGKVFKLTILLGLAVWYVPASAASDRYWGYQYKQITVTAEGDDEYARSLAHNLYRLDLSIQAVLQSNGATQWRSPTEVYAVPGDLFAEFTGLKPDIPSHSSANYYGTNILVNTSAKGSNRYWQVYFGYASSILASSYSFRYPQWFISGLSEVFAASAVERTHVTIGGASPGRVYSLLRGRWIPLQMLLSTRWNDPQMSSKDFADMYYAETWYLVHKIVIDQFYSTDFHQYFNRLDHGETEKSAFGASFDVSVDALDKALQKTISKGDFKQVKVTIADVDDGSKPVRLTEAQTKSRLALYAAVYGVQPQSAMTLSADALKLDPENEDAQAARIRAELRGSDFDVGLRDANDTCRSDGNSGQTLRSCGFAYFVFAKNSNKPLLSMSKADLNSKALVFYERAVQLDAADLQSWYGLAAVVCDIGNLDYAKTLLPKIVTTQATYPHVGALAGSVARLYALVGDNDNAMKYALLWQAGSISGAEKAAAMAYIAHLKDDNARKQAASEVSTPNG
jgi:tetratricopeptide (TPR) repeat protein